ncbi:MAG: restriction endonuclease [Candidatus Saccharimonas sp.]|nr:restriction endonuclease [Planctomycetaceae bacterium]
MLDPEFESELCRELLQLPAAEQRKVLAYAKRLVAASQSRVIDLCELEGQKFDAMLPFILAAHGFKRVSTGPFLREVDINLRVTDANERMYLVQCKPWTELSIGVRAVRVLSTIIAREKAKGGFIVTTGTFTHHATRLARQHRIILIDGHLLLKQLARLKTDDQGRPVQFVISRLHELKPEMRGCPICGGPMVRRTAISGAYIGKSFRVCGRFPQCRGRRRIPDI